MAAGITIIGMGTGEPDELTVRAARSLTDNKSVVVVSDWLVDLIASVAPSVHVQVLDVDNLSDLVLQLMDLASRAEGVVYASPGNPAIDDIVTQSLIEAVDELDFPIEVIPGVSLLDTDMATLGLEPALGLQIVDAAILADRHHPPLDPDVPALIVDLNESVAADAVTTLLNQYHGDHPVQLVDLDATIRLDELAERVQGSDTTALLFALGEPGSISSYQDVMARLRAPDGCPWDAEQTHESLRTHLLEETYEVLAALDAGDTQELMEELGDLLLQILFHAQIGAETGEFKLIDTIQYVVRKLIRRHPHVFGQTEVNDAGEVLVNWEQIKRQERQEAGEGEDAFKSMLSGINRALPSLARAIEVQRRAARVGFDWPDIAPVRGKVAEEMAEFEEAETDAERMAEFGDLVFALVNLARWHDIDAESALRYAVNKFERRFEVIERHAAQTGVPLEDMTLEQMDAIWDHAKALEQDS